jgi:hypothetical protein
LNRYVVELGSDGEKRRWLEAFRAERAKVAAAALAGVSLVDLASAELGASDGGSKHVRDIQSRVKAHDRMLKKRPRPSGGGSQ